MGFDFKNGSGKGGSQGGFSSPFGGSTEPAKKDNGTGFSFGGANENKPAGSKSGGGFNFPTGKKTAQSGSGFSNLPTTTDRRTPAPRGNNFGGGRSASFDVSIIPWRAIIYFLLVVTALALIIYFWDVIIYVAYNLITLLILIVVLLLVIRWLLRKR